MIAHPGADGSNPDRPLRVLIYNWVDHLDDERRGGGVSLYQSNLANALFARNDVDATFLSSGLSYDLFRRAKPRWTRVCHGRSQQPGRFEIVNSAVMAPSHHSLGSPAQIRDQATENAFESFLGSTGPYDVVHFNSLEGLPANVLASRRAFPDTRFILSLHNYYPFCQQVNLWFDESESCTDYADGAKCIDCVPNRPPESLVRLANALAYRLKLNGIRPGTRLFDFAFGTALRLGRRATRFGRPRRHRPAATSAGRQAALNAERRATMVRLINSHCDAVLCVSNRVRDIAVGHGVRPDLLLTQYIGTAAAECFDRNAPRRGAPRHDGTLTLGFLGYMRRDKGFFFLLAALERLPLHLARRIRLIVAAREGPMGAMARLRGLQGRLASVVHYDGYDHTDLDCILAPVDIGLVPVLWEDNLPQVAIEMHSRRIPLLTSDIGGARELANCPELVFRAGSFCSFEDRIRFLLGGGLDQDRYWQQALRPQTMNAHLDDLMRVYRGSCTARSKPFRAA